MGLCSSTDVETRESSLNLEAILVEAGGIVTKTRPGLKDSGSPKKPFRASIKGDAFHDHMVEEHQKERVLEKYEWDSKSPESLGTGTSGTVIAGEYNLTGVREEERGAVCGERDGRGGAQRYKS